MSTIRQGLPTCGAEGRFQAFDKDGNLYVIRWNDEMGCFCGFGFDPNFTRPLGFGFALKGDMADFIVSHALPANVVEAETPDDGALWLNTDPNSKRWWMNHAPAGMRPIIKLDGIIQRHVTEAKAGDDGFVRRLALNTSDSFASKDGRLVEETVTGLVEIDWEGPTEGLATDE